jgi:hypothetical protein
MIEDLLAFERCQQKTGCRLQRDTDAAAPAPRQLATSPIRRTTFDNEPLCHLLASAPVGRTNQPMP